jgi:hypothetical protein
MNLNRLRDTSFEIAKSKGWHDEDAPRASFADRCALMISELSEALEEYRAGHDVTEIYFAARHVRGDEGDFAGWSSKTSPLEEAHALAECGSKPEGIPIEIADVCIRIGDCAGRHQLDLDAALERLFQQGFMVPDLRGKPLSDWLLRITSQVLDAWETCGPDGTPGDPSTTGLVLAIVTARDMAEALRFDLEGAIQIKHAYNRTRPYRHGGKKI